MFSHGIRLPLPGEGNMTKLINFSQAFAVPVGIP